jgi:transketolase
MHATLREQARRIRLKVVEMTSRGKASHVGSSLSIVELLVALYGGKTLRVDPARPDWPDRDRFVLSKGHACAALYAVLAEGGFFPAAWLDTFYANGSKLAGHATHGIPGIEVSTGSLGHGLPIAAGMALAARRDGRPSRAFALLSDGECDEGSTWEAALFAGHHRLDNLVALVDYNTIQSLGFVKDILDLEPFAAKWRDFGWAVREVDGHDVDQVMAALSAVPFEAGRPSCLLAHTVKGKGVSFMENTVLWHYRTPQGTELRDALAELGGCE